MAHYDLKVEYVKVLLDLYYSYHIKGEAQLYVTVIQDICFSFFWPGNELRTMLLCSTAVKSQAGPVGGHWKGFELETTSLILLDENCLVKCCDFCFTHMFCLL